MQAWRERATGRTGAASAENQVTNCKGCLVVAMFHTTNGRLLNKGVFESKMYGRKSKQRYRYAAHHLGYAKQRASTEEGHGDEMIMAVL